MTPYEMMLSETQERMLLIIKPDKKKITLNIFKKWGLEAIEIGHLTDTGKCKCTLIKKSLVNYQLNHWLIHHRNMIGQ